MTTFSRQGATNLARLSRWAMSHRYLSSSSFSPKAQAFDALVRSRFSDKSFASSPIPSHVLRHMLELTQLSPSSFNMQPFRIVIVQSAQMRNAVADRAMLGGNIDAVRKAPVLAVFVADSDPTRSARKLVELENERQQQQHGSNTSVGARVINDGRGVFSAASVFYARGWLARRALQFGAHLLSPITPSPLLGFSMEEWASKNTSLAAMTFMLAASSHDLISCPMEGFDERRMKSLLSIPEQGYHVPMVVAVGYPKTQNVGGGEPNTNKPPSPPQPPLQRRVRFPLDYCCFGERFNEKLDI